jgi:hypothetical protein
VAASSHCLDGLHHDCGSARIKTCKQPYVNTTCYSVISSQVACG